ncbi:DUF3426 domain-containing protein [Paraburkholderia acidisoli]|uniref:DUF3426 domain-containing protein n=1 Tax=Paraburkholderia acidisoli TaxID=2571748 RepID=A0A7Z2JFQ1_9BURK|nr:DUF3426 domain-containing protein [Paraburkholderia acidisoli]
MPAHAAVAPEAVAEPIDVPVPAARAAAPAAQTSQTAQAAQAFHAAQAPQAAPAPQPAPPVQPTEPAQAAEPFPPATRWTRVEPGLAAAAPVEPTFSGQEPAHARLDDSEPTLVNRAHDAPRESDREADREAAHEAAAREPRGFEPEAAHRGGWQAAPETAAPAFSALEPNEGGQSFAVTREAPARARAGRRAGWRVLGAIVALLLFALFVVQIAWWQRETVMVYWPNSQPLYLKACAQLGCRVLPPRDIDGLLVEPSDLRQVDNEPHHLELKVPLRNRFNVALAYPAIELSLLDRQNNIVVRRVLWPQDYVTPGTRVEAGLPAHTTQTMIVRLDTGDVVASNFRIEIFYP